MTDFQRRFFLRVLMIVSLTAALVGGFGCSGEDPGKMFQQGIDAMTAENLDEALIWFKKALQQDPEMAQAHYRLGEVYQRKGEASMAYAELSRAVELDPQLKDARKKMAFLLIENRALEQAIVVCKDFLEVNGNDEDIYLILGNGLVYTKKYQEAAAVFKEGLQNYPGHQLLTLNLGRTLIVKGDLEEGLAIMKELALQETGNIGVQIALAETYEKLERYDLAVLTVEAVKEQFPENPLPFFFLAQLSMKKGKADKALKILQSAEQAGIRDSRLYRMSALICQQQGNPDQALKYFQQAVAAATDETRQTNQMILADYYTYLDKYREAQEILQTIIAEDSSKTALKSKVVELFMAEGEFDQARASVDALLKEDSSNARGHYLKGLMMLQDKNVAEAREAFSKAKELAPDAAENQFLYGMTFVNESDQVSIFEISEALKKNPNLYKARLALAEIYARKGEFQKSLDELDRFLASQEKRKQLDNIVDKELDRVAARVLRIALLLKMKKADAALADAELLVEEQPDVIGHRFRLADIYYFMGEYDKALLLYEQLQKEKSDSIRIAGKIVALFMLKKEPEKAMATIDSFLAKYPHNDAAMMLKAKIYLSQGYVDLAENVLLPEAEKSENGALIVMLAEIYKAQGDVPKSIGYFQEAMELLPEDIGIMMKLADLYLLSNRKEEAIASYEGVLRQKGDFLPAMNNLAFLYAEEGRDLDRALALSNDVYKKIPNNPDVADTLGWIYVMKNVYSQAEPYLQQAMSAKPENPSILYHMGLLRYGQKQQGKAESLLTLAIEKGLSDKDLAEAKAIITAISLSKEKLLEAEAQKKQGNTEQAITLLEEIMADEEFNLTAAAELAILYAEQDKDLTRAFELARKAYAIQPKNPKIADALGWLYYQQGSLLLAKQYLEEALEHDDEYAPARRHLAAVHLKEEEE